MCTCVCVHIYACVYTYTYMCICICIYIHIYIVCIDTHTVVYGAYRLGRLRSKIVVLETVSVFGYIGPVAFLSLIRKQMKAGTHASEFPLWRNAESCLSHPPAELCFEPSSRGCQALTCSQHALSFKFHFKTRDSSNLRYIPPEVLRSF